MRSNDRRDRRALRHRVGRAPGSRRVLFVDEAASSSMPRGRRRQWLSAERPRT
jgi:hypothetical protein